MDNSCSHLEYRLIRKLGEGTFSEVLKAESVKTKQKVAIKCMKSHFDNIEKVSAQQKQLKWLGAKFERNQSSTTSLAPQSHHPAHRGALRWTHRQISTGLWNYGNEPIWGNQRSLELPARASSQEVHVSVAQGNWAYASQRHFPQRHQTVSKRIKIPPTTHLLQRKHLARQRNDQTSGSRLL